MLRKTTLTLLLFGIILNFQTSYAQKRWRPTPEEIQRAKNLKDKYKDEKDVEIVALDVEQVFNFNIDKKSKSLKVTETTKENLMNIGEKTRIFKYVFYDNNSKIKKFKLAGKNKKSYGLKYGIKDEYVKVGGLFYHDQRVKYVPVDFPFQAYRFLFSYEKEYSDPKYFTQVFFVQNEPVLKKTVKFIIPKNVKVELKEYNFKGYNISKKQHFDPKLNANIITYTIKDLPARFKESHEQGPTYIYPHILVLTKSYKYQNKSHRLFEETADLYKWYHSLIKKLKEKPSELTSIVNELTKGAKTDEEKVKNIFYWVQDNIRYIAFEDGLAGFKPDESQNVLQKRYGDCKGMANLTTAMLKKAGFDARRTWIGTRRIAYDYSTPSLAVDNHMISTLFLNGKTYYLDATESYVPFGEYAERIQGREVMIEDGDKYLLKKVPVHDAKHNLKTYTKTINVKGEQLTGHVDENYKGQSRTTFLQAYNELETNKKSDALNYYITGDDGNFDISNVKTSDIKNREKDVELHYDYVLNNAVSSFDDEMYIDLDYEKDFDGLDLKKRKTGYEFYNKIDSKSIITLNIPTGYKIAEMPQNLSIDNEDFKVNITFSKQGQKLIYKKEFIFPNAIIHKKNLKAWQDFYKKLHNLYQTQLTLIKS